MADRTLVLLRHAKSDWSGPLSDRDRPLAERGRRQAPEAGSWLAEHVPGIDLAVVPPAARARETWELVTAELEGDPAVRVEDRLYGASDDELLAVTRELPDDLTLVVLVGHNPGLEDLVSMLSGESVRMPTSAIAVLSVTGSWATIDSVTVTLSAAGRPPAL